MSFTYKMAAKPTGIYTKHVTVNLCVGKLTATNRMLRARFETVILAVLLLISLASVTADTADDPCPATPSDDDDTCIAPVEEESTDGGVVATPLSLDESDDDVIDTTATGKIGLSVIIGISADNNRYAAAKTVTC